MGFLVNILKYSVFKYLRCFRPSQVSFAPVIPYLDSGNTTSLAPGSVPRVPTSSPCRFLAFGYRNMLQAHGAHFLPLTQHGHFLLKDVRLLLEGNAIERPQ